MGYNTQNYMGVDVSHDSSRNVWNLTASTGETLTTKTITAESLAVSQVDLMKQEIEKMKAEMRATIQKPQRSYSDIADAMYYSQLANKTLAPGRIEKLENPASIKPVMVLNSNQFSKEAARQFAIQNPTTQVVLAPDPSTAIRFYPDTFGGKFAPTGAPFPTTKPVKAKPLSQTRPEKQQWKYANL